MLKTQLLEYQDDDVTLEGFYAFDDTATENRPVILIAHDWSGRNNLSESKAKVLAELGYIGFAIDMYGKGKRGQTKEEKMALIKPFTTDRRKLQKRILAAFEAAKKLPKADPNKIGAMGYCFGGLCALDLARSGADVKGVVSFHGLLMPPEGVQPEKITAKVLVLHGFDDPMVTPDQITHFGQEMTHAKVDWQLNVYGNAMHAFANPEANDPGFGTLYDKKADARSWIAMREFFKEVFGNRA